MEKKNTIKTLDIERCANIKILHINKICKTIIGLLVLSVVLYGCEKWYLILREERGLRVFENRVLRQMFRSKRDEE